MIHPVDAQTFHTHPKNVTLIVVLHEKNTKYYKCEDKSMPVWFTIKYVALLKLGFDIAVLETAM